MGGRVKGCNLAARTHCACDARRDIIPQNSRSRVSPMSETDIRIYTTPICPYCYRAKALLKKKGAVFEEIDVFMDARARTEMEAKTGCHTVPQIFIGEKHIGGCDDLMELEAEGQLDLLLSA